MDAQARQHEIIRQFVAAATGLECLRTIGASESAIAEVQAKHSFLLEEIREALFQQLREEAKSDG